MKWLDTYAPAFLIACCVAGIIFIASQLPHSDSHKPSKKFIAKCSLIERSYHPAAKQQLRYVTIWDCGDYGIIVNHDEYIFTYGNEEQVLYLQKNYRDDYYIVGLA